MGHSKMSNMCSSFLLSKKKIIFIIVHTFNILYFFRKWIIFKFKRIQLIFYNKLLRMLSNLFQIVHNNRVIIKLFKISMMKFGKCRNAIILIIISLMRLGNNDSFLSSKVWCCTWNFIVSCGSKQIFVI